MKGEGKSELACQTVDASKFLIPETLTEDTLRLLADSGNIDQDLTGLQAFALFMPESEEIDQCSDPNSSSSALQPVSNDDDDIPPVISCHQLDILDRISEEELIDVETHEGK